MIAKSLPSLFTVGNLFLGIVSIILIFNDRPELAAIMVIAAMLLDGLDGRVARALNVTSEFGKELDSLSDVISFGVAPAVVMYVVSFQNVYPATAWILTAVFPICGALRLARFNVIDSVPGYFIGLPIPAAGGVLATLALFHQELPLLLLYIGDVALSLLMVSTIKYPSFKKFAIPRWVALMIPILLLGAVVVAIARPGFFTRLLFIPLVVYALLFGLKKNGAVRRIVRLRGKDDIEDLA